MKRKRKPFRLLGTIALPPDVKWDDLEFRDDLNAIHNEQGKKDAIARRRFEAQGRIIAADFERERKEQLAEALRKRAEYLMNLKAEELEEKMQAAAEADRKESRRVFTAYVEKVSKAFHLAVKNEAEDREQVAKRLKKIDADMQKTRLHDERIELARRGVIKGRRKWSL